MPNAVKHLLFDNDGTIVDSEIIAQRIFLALLQEHGLSLDDQEFSQRYAGLREREIMTQLHLDYGFLEPDGFSQKIREASQSGYALQLKAIPGMTSLFRKIKVPKSMVSNGSVRHVQQCLRRVKLLSAVDGQIFSAEHVHKPKPHPDVYLLALETIGVKTSETLAIEDSPFGVASAKSAGLSVIGFLGAAHIQDGHDKKLLESGADFIAYNAWELYQLLDARKVF